MEIQLSSYKNGSGLAELLSSNPLEFWHTDDNLPHFISIQFARRTFVEEVQLSMSFSRDDSYTPEVIELWSGLVRDGVALERKYEFLHPEGYTHLPLGKHVFYIYIVIRTNHQEGRDSRVRNLRILGENKTELFYNRTGNSRG